MSGPDAPRGRLRGLLVDLEPARRDREFRLLWLGQLISGVGRQVTVAARPMGAGNGRAGVLRRLCAA